jgi:hypothetical protein
MLALGSIGWPLSVSPSMYGGVEQLVAGGHLEYHFALRKRSVEQPRSPGADSRVARSERNAVAREDQRRARALVWISVGSSACSNYTLAIAAARRSR